MASKYNKPGTVVSNCTFTAQAGEPHKPDTVRAATVLAEVLLQQAKAVSDVAAMLKGTHPGVMQAGINIQG